MDEGDIKELRMLLANASRILDQVSASIRDVDSLSPETCDLVKEQLQATRETLKDLPSSSDLDWL